tara:strand:+ start:4116 stop:5321 length:1206 start_codon:yes stop_codon:yes gene_type:complete
MDEKFFDKSNFEMLYNLIDDHIIKTNQTSLDSLHINARALIFNSMEKKFTQRTKDMSIEDINKMVLRDCVPEFAKHVPKVPIADEQVNVFINSDKSNNDPVNHYKEDLEGTVLNIEKEQQPETSNIHRDLDISSSDRSEWSTNSSDTPYEFVVNLGVSSTFPGIGTPTNFQNVVSVNITHAIIPDTLSNSLDKYPFLYLQIDELQGAYQSTSDHGRRSFVKLIKDKKWSENTNSNISYNLMNTKGNGAKPSVGWNVDTPIAKLSKLTLRILSPNGFPIQIQKDVLQIATIQEQANTIEITCTQDFIPDTIYIQNRIGFRHLEFDAGNGQSIIDFLQNNEHNVVSVANNKKITINKPSNADYGLIGNSQNIYGFLMNLSFQSNFGFNIQSLRHTFQDSPQIV